MRAMKCDRCGKFCEYYTGRKTSKETNEFTLIDIYSDRKTYDLCPDCMRKFKEFLENK